MQETRDRSIQRSATATCVIVYLVVLSASSGNASQQGEPSLLAAAREGHVELASSLLDGGADIEIRSDLGQTALMLAAYEGRLNMVQVLLARGADVTARGRDGLSALVLAMERQHSDIERHLRRAGASLDESRSHKQTFDREPTLISKPRAPSYPESAKQHAVEGEVVLQILAKRDGSTEVLGVLKLVPYCTLIAIDNAKKWRWAPATNDGEMVDAMGIITIEFSVK